MGFLVFQYKKSQLDSFFVCSSIDNCLEHLTHDDSSDLAVGGSRKYILNSPSYSPQKIFCFDSDESIASYLMVLSMRKDFALKSKVDEIIRNAFEGGLFVKWDRETRRKTEPIRPYEPKLELTLKECAFVCFICLFGYILSNLTFICEIIIYRKIKKNGQSPVWKYLEQFFDGNRNYFRNLPENLKRNSK